MTIDPTDTDLREWVADGMGAQRIAAATGLSVWAVRKRLGALGLKAKRGGHPADSAARSASVRIPLSPAELARLQARAGDRPLAAWCRERLMEGLLDAPLADEEDEECLSCEGYGHFDGRGRATIDRRERACLDCGGTGRLPNARRVP